MARPHALVLGTGYAGQRHAEALRELGIPMTGPLSARGAMTDPAPIHERGIDVVHVCAANDLHAPLTVAALDAGKHVICEKPLALDVRTAEDLAARAGRSAGLAVLAYSYRFHPMLVELAARVSSGQLGEIHGVRGAFLQDWLLLPTDDNWRVDVARGGASRVVADIGSHWLDLAESATGRAVESVVAQVSHLHDRVTEDQAGLLLRFAGGLAGACVLSQAAAGHGNDLQLSIDGSSASASWRYERGDELWIGERGAAGIVSRLGELASADARRLARLPAGPNEARRNLLAAAYARLAGDERRAAAPLPTFADGVRHLRFAAAALESAKRRTWVDVG
jgi:predicted dehydrogenase